MKITIDKLGRVVIPKHIRERYNMQPGTVLEIENESEGVRLKVIEKKPSLIHKQGILVHHGEETINIDTAAVINRERERRNSDIVAEQPKE
jgi:AbrB family looped-hinge helix DNA binding protein